MSLFFIIFYFLFGSCKNFRQQFAEEISWIPDHKCVLVTPSGVASVLDKVIPVILSIKFDTESNKKNKPQPLHKWEKFTVNEDIIDFLVKDVRVEGGKGKLFYRTEIDGKSSIGEPFESGNKVKHGATKLYYVPDTKEDCHRHKVSIVSTILTNDFAREAGKPLICSLKLDEPSYNLKANSDCKIAYVEDKGTPIKVTIVSNNELAAHQKYRLVSWYVTGGKGIMYVGDDKKPVCNLMPLHFGSNTLFYAPKPGSDGNHTIHFTVGNTKGDSTQESSFSVKVEDHKIENFTAELALASEDTPLLPFKDRVCKLTITPLTDPGKVLPYHVKAIKMHGGKFILGKDQIIEGTALTAGVNALIFSPSGSVGDLTPSITIVNRKGDQREVTFKQPFIVKDPAFKVVGSLEGNIENGMDNRYINLNIMAPFNTTSDKFVLSNYRLSGGIAGDLLKIKGDPATLGGMLSVGDSAFKFRLADIDEFIDKIDGAPKLYFDIVYPDGTHHETEPIDLSIFLFEALASKLSSLNNDGQGLYKPLVEDYSIPSAPALQNLKDIEPAWYDRQSNLHHILVYMQHDTAVSPQVTDALVNLQTLKKDTKHKANKRVLTTQLLNRWYDEMNSIHSSQDPDDCKIRTEILEREVGGFSNVFEGCGEMLGMEDIPPNLVGVKAQIEELKKGMIQKYSKKDEKEEEYKSFQRETRSAIRTERETREYDVSVLKSKNQRLGREIEELCDSRDDLEYKIRIHDGDISKLNSLMEELSRLNSDLRRKLQSVSSIGYRIKGIESEMQNLWNGQTGIYKIFKKSDRTKELESERIGLTKKLCEIDK